MNTPRTIAVAYASIGSGSRIAAEAVVSELNDLSGGEVVVELTDVLSPVRAGGEEAAGRSATHALAGFAHGSRARGFAATALRTMLTPLLRAKYGRFAEALAGMQPEAIVCTHPLAAILALGPAARGSLKTRVYGVMTDFAVSPMWPRLGLDCLYVSHPGVIEEAAAYGLSETALSVTGIPVRPQFMLEYDLSAARRHFGLPEDRRIVLAMAGGAGPEGYDNFADALEVALPALASLPNSSLVVVTGNDTELADDLRGRAHGFANRNVHVLGFVDRIAPLITAADLVIARPGGVTCAECLSVGTPLLLLGPAGGLDRDNVTTLVQAGAAHYAHEPLATAERARLALCNKARLEGLRTRAVELARPFAAKDIAERVLGIRERCS